MALARLMQIQGQRTMKGPGTFPGADAQASFGFYPRKLGYVVPFCPISVIGMPPFSAKRYNLRIAEDPVHCRIKHGHVSRGARIPYHTLI
jgi:hypothetical protein